MTIDTNSYIDCYFDFVGTEYERNAFSNSRPQSPWLDHELEDEGAGSPPGETRGLLRAA